MNEYNDLLTHLINKGSLTITANVTTAAIRKGLQSAISSYNLNANILETEPFMQSFSIAKADKAGAVTITVIEHQEEEQARAGKGKFSFELVDEDKEDDSTT